MKTNTNRNRHGFTLVELLVVVSIIVALAGITASVAIPMMKKKDLITATSNGKQLYLGLKQFADEYNSYPDKNTAKEVADRRGSKLNLNGDTSNDYFRQLIAAGFVKVEEPFYAKCAASKKKGDNNVTGTEAIKVGECGWGYIMNSNGGGVALTDDNPSRVIAVSPLAKDSAKGEFDASQFGDKAVLVKLDGSAETRDIREDKKVSMGGKHTLMDVGEETCWGTDIKPVIKVPKK